MLLRLLIVLALLASACVDEMPTASSTPSPAPASAGGLAGFPPCGSRSPSGVSAPPGASLPDSAIVGSVDDRDPLVYIRGYIGETPVALRERYESDVALDVLVIEDEGVEVETLVTDGSHRTFFKANAVCATGSTFIAVVAPEVEASLVPTPTGPAG